MFGERVKALRKERKMTQSELAQVAGVTKGTVALWEQGQRNPSLPVVKKLSAFFDKSVDYILGNTDDATPIYTDADYLGMEDGMEQDEEQFNGYYQLDDFGKQAVDEVYRLQRERCIAQKTLIPEVATEVRVRVMMKDHVRKAQDVAPHDPILDPPSVEEMFQPVTDEEIAELEKHIKK